MINITQYINLENQYLQCIQQCTASTVQAECSNHRVWLEHSTNTIPSIIFYKFTIKKLSRKEYVGWNELRPVAIFIYCLGFISHFGLSYIFTALPALLTNTERH